MLPGPPRYLFLNCAPGVGWNQNRPETITEKLFREPMAALAPADAPEEQRVRPGISLILSYLNGPRETLAETLRRVLALSERDSVPVLIVLDGQNWWGDRPDLWNWWDRARPGYAPGNAENVEWTDWGPEHAVKVCWRNWGRQIRVLPAPNIAAPRFRAAARESLPELASILRKWASALPPEKRWLFPGVKVGWEASIGVNAYHYPDGNRLLDRPEADDPKQGLDMKSGFSGGLATLGHAALASKGWKRGGAVTLADHERLVADYLAFLARLCREAGLKRDEVFTHAGGQYAPWEKHYSHRVAINGDSVPGWSLYGDTPDRAGDLGASLERARRDDWCAAEWLPLGAKTSADWRDAALATLGYRRCRSLSVYNWEGIRGNPEAIDGLRQALAEPQPEGRGHSSRP